MAKTEWSVFIDQLLSHKRANRPYKLPKEYIKSIADAIHKASPTVPILINKLSELYETGFSRGYTRCISDFKFRRDKRNARLKEDWDKEFTAIEDEIFNQNNQ